MAEKSIYYAKDTNELLYLLKSIKELKIIGGMTKLSKMPQKSVSTFGIKELSQIDIHERYINAGSAATLNDLLNLGERIPEILSEALKSTANPVIRNMATIGGNLCFTEHQQTLFAPLLALDSRLEFKNTSETKIIPIQNFRFVPQGFALTNIRIPIPDADISVFRRTGPEHTINEFSSSYAFLASTEKNTLLNVRIAFAGPFPFRNRNMETSLIGRRLPLTQKEVQKITDIVTQEFNSTATDQMLSGIVRQQFVNLVRYSFEQLT